MTEIERALKSFKSILYKILITFIFSTIIAFTGFYYNTRSAIQYQNEQIKELKCKIDFLIQIHIKP